MTRNIPLPIGGLLTFAFVFAWIVTIFIVAPSIGPFFFESLFPLGGKIIIAALYLIAALLPWTYHLAIRSDKPAGSERFILSTSKMACYAFSFIALLLTLLFAFVYDHLGVFLATLDFTGWPETIYVFALFTLAPVGIIVMIMSLLPDRLSSRRAIWGIVILTLLANTLLLSALFILDEESSIANLDKLTGIRLPAIDQFLYWLPLAIIFLAIVIADLAALSLRKHISVESYVNP